MGVSLLDSCGDGCGWMAAIVAVLAWGSFGVPIKHVHNIDVNPLVMQSYKTTVCFLTSWLVILLGEDVRWSTWGLASGLFWVPGAACGIYGIRNAGLAIAVGTWSSLNVLTSFFFGIVIFQERVKDLFATILAFGCLVLGLIGMSRYSAHQQTDEETMDIKEGVERTSVVMRTSSIAKQRNTSIVEVPNNSDGGSPASVTNGVMAALEIEPLLSEDHDDEDLIMGAGASPRNEKDPSHKDRLVFWGGRLSFTRRQLGVLGAVINGAWGGMNLIPLHYAMENDGLTGAGFLISYATGALIVNTAIWILLYCYYLYQKKGQWRDAADCLPRWHLDHLLYPGLMAGLLFSLGNFGSILAVTYVSVWIVAPVAAAGCVSYLTISPSAVETQLGQGTGFSFCQMQLFVSGLWGVFYFREIRGKDTIGKWFLSAFVAVFGIIWLSYEHEGGTAVGHR